jgi:hypothetical protein
MNKILQNLLILALLINLNCYTNINGPSPTMSIFIAFSWIFLIVSVISLLTILFGDRERRKAAIYVCIVSLIIGLIFIY